MADIENRAKPILLTMMAGERRTLSPDELRIVAEWAQLKALCWHALRVSEGTEPALKEETYGRFHLSRPLDWAVNAVHVESESPAEIDLGFLHGVAQVNGNTSRFFRCSIRFDQLYLGVSTTTEDDDLTTGAELADLVPYSHRIWPPPNGEVAPTLSWPPTRHQYTSLERRGILLGDPLAYAEMQDKGLVPRTNEIVVE